MRAVRLLLLVLLAAVLVPAYAGRPDPLSDAELEALMPDLLAYSRMRDAEYLAFKSDRLSPAVAERLFATPAFVGPQAALPSESMRAHAVGLLGTAHVLRFDKPSDVLSIMRRLLPSELPPVLAADDKELHLHGPLLHWNDDALAFMTLWNCLPRVAWLRPTEDPFAAPVRWYTQLARGFNPVYSSDQDFGKCVRTASPRVSGLDEGESRALGDMAKQVADRAIPLLSDRLARHLQTRGCEGTGPDDCVLLLLAWSDIAPADRRLAAALQRLEPQVGLERPLPALLKPPASYGPYGEAAALEPFHAAFLRRAAFLRARMASMLALPGVWSEDAWAATLPALNSLSRTVAANIAPHWSGLGLDRSPWLNPWRVFERQTDRPAALREQAMVRLMNLDADDETCTAHAMWGALAGKWSDEEVLVRTIEAGRSPRQSACSQPQLQGLAAQRSPEAQHLLERLVNSLGRSAVPGSVREDLLSALTRSGAACFASDESTPSPAINSLCRRWIHEPQHGPVALPHAGLRLTRAEAFLRKEWQVTDGRPFGDRAWYQSVAAGLDPAVLPTWERLMTSLRAQGRLLRAATRWQRTGHPQVLVFLEFSNNTSAWYVLTPGAAESFQVPARLREGQSGGLPARVSDLDRDGHLELWWAPRFDGCTRSTDDAQRDMECQALEADMGEIDGDTVTYFVLDPPVIPKPRQQTPQGGSRDVGEELREPPCNVGQLAWVLSREFDLAFGQLLNQVEGDVLDITCKPHPDLPGHWLVALFHGQEAEFNVELMLALVDMRDRRIVRIGRAPVAADATTRFSDGSLKLDTARYFLQPGLRAIGVRMGIGWSSRAAEGGDNDYLMLFAPSDAESYRLVIDGLAMSRWRRGADCFGGQSGADGCTTTSQTLTLSVDSGETRGWRDLLVKVKTTQEGPQPAAYEWPLTAPHRLRMGASGKYE